MSESTGGRNGGVKTFAVRVPDDLHAQFVLIAGLEDLTLNDAGGLAIQMLVDAKRGDGDFSARAAEALAEIERESEARRNAIRALFSEPVPDGNAPKRRPRGTGTTD